MQEQKATVLVVDDNEINRDVLSRRLIRYGHETTTAVNGREALRLIRQQEFDLVLLDIMMPEMNGYQVLERIKEDPLTRNLPVIVISALDDIESIVKCIKLGAEDYLPKPFNPMLLKARIGASLDKKRLRDREQEHLEEQAVAQRIDRELNAKLDMRGIARITLDWAKRRSEADMLLISLVEEEGLRIVDSYGFDEMREYYADGVIAPDAPPLRKAMRTILPQASEDRRDFFVQGMEKQVVIPIGRAGQVIAMLILESREASRFSNYVLSFLTRLCDRAAVALANAQLYEEVQAANRAKSEFVGEVTHELNNPLTSVLNYAKMIDSMGDVNEMQTHCIKTIINNANRMAQLVQDLKEVSKLEAGHLKLEPDAVNMRQIIRDVIDSFNSQIEDKGQNLVVDVAETLPLVWCDRNRTTQVLTNLVSNAHKYTPEEGHITVKAHLNGDESVHVAVQDTGIGLRPEDQAKIFQKYFRAADEKAQASPGTGLGLNITKRLVELQGGTIWFDSEFRKGTTFHFTVPVADGQGLEDPLG